MRACTADMNAMQAHFSCIGIGVGLGIGLALNRYVAIMAIFTDVTVETKDQPFWSCLPLARGLCQCK